MPDATTSWAGALVRLRAVEPADWEHFRRWDEDTESARFGYFVHMPVSEKTNQQFAEDVSRDSQDHNRRWIIETLAGEPAGSLNVHGAEPRNGTFEYGLTVAREHWGKGFGAEAITIVLRYYFDELRYQKVLSVVYSFNERSQRLHQKLGFVEEGRLRRAHYSNGELHDSILYGMLAEEFRDLHGRLTLA
ncbi:MAG: GNAT family protein [Dehalococcoidia bacterium]